MHEVLARRGRPIIVCSAGDEEVRRLAYRVIEVPASVDCLQSVINVVPLQLLAFHLAVLNQHDVRRHLLCHSSVILIRVHTYSYIQVNLLVHYVLVHRLTSIWVDVQMTREYCTVLYCTCESRFSFARYLYCLPSLST